MKYRLRRLGSIYVLDSPNGQPMDEVTCKTITSNWPETAPPVVVFDEPVEVADFTGFVADGS